jgi:glycosyltransferase 2 family protein
VTAARRLIAGGAGSTWIRLLVSGAILAFLLSGLDVAAASRAVLSIDRRFLLAVLVLVGLDRAVMIYRWLLLLRASHAHVDAAQAARIFLVSSFVGSFLPAGVGGDAARAYGLSRLTDAGDEAVASVFVDRLLGVLSLLVMGAVGLLAWTPPTGMDWRAVAIALAMTAGCISAFWLDRFLVLVPHTLRGSRVGRLAEGVGLAVGRYRRRGFVLGHVMLWSLTVQVLRITQAYLLGLGLGIPVPFRYYLLFMPVGLLMLLLPVSISGFGLPQGVIVWLMRPMGVADEQSFALSTLIVLTGLAGNLPGLWLWVRGMKGSGARGQGST